MVFLRYKWEYNLDLYWGNINQSHSGTCKFNFLLIGNILGGVAAAAAGGQVEGGG